VLERNIGLYPSKVKRRIADRSPGPALRRRRGRGRDQVTIALESHVAGLEGFSTVRMADLIVVLEGSRLVEVGTHDELMARGGHYAELYSIQAAAYQ